MANEIFVTAERCTGCSLCVKTCPVDAIKMIERPQHPNKWKLATINEKCVFCNACVVECDRLAEKTKKTDVFHAIVMHKDASTAPVIDTTLYKGVWCFAEQRHGKIVPTIYELLHVGGKMAKVLDEQLCVVLMGHGVKETAQDLIDHGADKVYVLDHPKLARFLEGAYAPILKDLILKEKPNKFLMAASAVGRSLAPRLAVMTHTGITADATEFDINPTTKMMHATRPSFGGNLMATILCERSRPEMATMRPMSFPMAKKVPGHKGEVKIVPIDDSMIQPREEFVEFIPDQDSASDISTAEVVVSGGKGVGNAKGFELLRELAKALGGEAVGASRAAVDSGWISYPHQIGLTGRTVRPKLYIACGISGQVQHLAGMSQAEVVVAINKDADCPMMKLATYALQGDLYEIIPAILAALKKPNTPALT
ncbi:MAG: FAD-binding protein [Elusimicrobiota bacterium]